MFGKTSIKTTPVVSGKTVRSMATGLYLGIAALGLAGIGSTAYAAPITIPAGLSAGDQYRIAFITSTGRDGTSGDIADYNDFVTGVANGVGELAALDTTWTAIASTGDIDARDNTGTNPIDDGLGVAIYLLDGAKLADDNGDLWDGSIDTFFIVDENGDTVPSGSGQIAWTGTDSDGTADVFSYLGLGPLSARTGWGGLSDSNWVEFITFTTGSLLSLYAISDILTVPEPGTLAIFGLGLAGLGVLRRRRSG